LINNFFSVRCEETGRATLLAFGPSYSPLPTEDGSQARDFGVGLFKSRLNQILSNYVFQWTVSRERSYSIIVAMG